MSERSVSIPRTLGALLFGGLGATMLAGIMNLQTVQYYRTYKKDSIPLKLLVGTVWLLDNLHTGFIWSAMWEYLIQDYGEPSTADKIPWGIAFTVLVTAIVTFLTHCFFGQRIYLLSKKKMYMAGPVFALALCRLVSATVTTVKMFEYRSLSQFQAHVRWVFTLGLAISSGVDVLITGFLFYLFQSSRTKSGNFPLNHIIDKLMRYAFETGSLTCAGTIITMICWIAMPKNLVFLGLYFVIAKLYTSSLLVTLNAREKIRRERASESNQVMFLEPSPMKSGSGSRGSHDGPSTTKLQINVQTRTERGVY
ncbi:hypothetical protein C8J57DRAFT_1273461 [Mycena rebaudengoi]|nr:hypothetical protein C8J57DRAFT_1273461 [Mycena rebaudengoi]